MKLAYYPGCVSRSTGIEYDLSTRAVARALGLELEELDDWNCCGATHSSNELLAVGLAARNLAMTDSPIMTSCSICYSNLRAAAQSLEKNGVRERINSVLERKYEAADVRHVAAVLLEALEIDDGAKRIVVPLGGLKVAPYYGCLLTRPKNGIDSPENPQILERLIRTLKGEPVDFPLKMLCCGGPIFMPEDDAASESIHHILKSALHAGAEAIMAVCPLCHLMLDVKQRAVETRYGERIGLPVLYVTQIAGIALGLGPEELGLLKNSISPMAVVERVYQRVAEEGQ